MASSRQARRMRTAISPRLAIRIFLNMPAIECSGILACAWFVNLRHFTCVSNRLRYNGYLQCGKRRCPGRGEHAAHSKTKVDAHRGDFTVFSSDFAVYDVAIACAAAG